MSGCGQETPQPEVRNIEDTSMPIVSKEPEKTEISGTCGNVNWTLSKDYALTIGHPNAEDASQAIYYAEIGRAHV